MFVSRFRLALGVAQNSNTFTALLNCVLKHFPLPILGLILFLLAGLPLKYEDHSLLLALDGCIDTPVWSLLPYAFAASFSSESWRK